MRRRLLQLAVVAIVALPDGSALAQDPVAQFYKGRQITVIVGSSAGGGYDIYARLLARHMPKHIPGNAGVMVTNMPGAGSNAAAAHLFNVAPKDGTTIGALQNSAVMDALFDALLGNARQLRHDATKFVHLGSATTDHYVCIARSDAPIRTFKDTLTREFLIGASQPGTSTRDYPAMLNNTTGARIRQVGGYPGTREITLAIEKNEVQGLCGFSWSSLQAQRPDWIKSGFIWSTPRKRSAVPTCWRPACRRIGSRRCAGRSRRRCRTGSCWRRRSGSGSPSIRSRARTCRRWPPIFSRHPRASSKRPSRR